MHFGKQLCHSSQFVSVFILHKLTSPDENISLVRRRTMQNCTMNTMNSSLFFSQILNQLRPSCNSLNIRCSSAYMKFFSILIQISIFVFFFSLVFIDFFSFGCFCRHVKSSNILLFFSHFIVSTSNEQRIGLVEKELHM